METLTEDILPKGGFPVAASPLFYACVSNNPDLSESVRGLELIDGTALDVLKRARTMVHDGWKLASSPLYGNFKPWSTPYRTLILCRDDPDVKNSPPDTRSVEMIENAVVGFEAAAPRGKVLSVSSFDEEFRYIDFMLMDASFKHCGLSLNEHKGLRKQSQ